MTAFTFSGSIDSKGRITIPARIRNKLGVEKGDKVYLSLNSAQVIVEEVDSYSEALEFIQSLGKLRSFSYSDGVVEVALSD